MVDGYGSLQGPSNSPLVWNIKIEVVTPPPPRQATHGFSLGNPRSGNLEKSWHDGNTRVQWRGRVTWLTFSALKRFLGLVQVGRLDLTFFFFLLFLEAHPGDAQGLQMAQCSGSLLTVLRGPFRARDQILAFYKQNVFLLFLWPWLPSYLSA